MEGRGGEKSDEPGLKDFGGWKCGFRQRRWAVGGGRRAVGNTTARATNAATAGIPTPQIQSTTSKPFADSTNRRKKITGRGDDFPSGEGDRM